MKRVCAFLVILAVLTTFTAAYAQNTLSKYDEEIDLHFVRWIDETFQSTVAAYGESMEDNFWLDTYRDELGINVVYDWITNTSEYNRKLNLAMTTLDLPDVFTCTLSQMAQLADAEAIQPLGEVFEQYASDFLKEIVYQEGDTAMKAAMYNGLQYSIPNIGGSIDSADVMWLRQDWLEALNLKVPETIDDFHAMLKAFVAEDFDGNGENDSVGMVVAGVDPWGSVGTITPIFNAFGAYPNIWVERDGALENGSTQPEVKDALSFLNTLYNENLIDHEFIVKDGGVASEAIANGKCGVIFGKQWLPIWPISNSYYNDTSAVWTAYEIPTATDHKVIGQMTLGTMDYVVVNSNCEHPEAIIKMMNLFVEKCWGKTGDNAVYYSPETVEGIWKLSPVYPTMPMKNIDAFLALENARATGDDSLVTGEAKSIKTKLDLFAKDPAANAGHWGWTRIYGPAPTPYSIFATRLEENRTIMDGYLGTPTETAMDIGSELSSMQNQTYLKIITGEMDIEAFDTFVSEYNTLGGTDIREEINEWYNASK